MIRRSPYNWIPMAFGFSILMASSGCITSTQALSANSNRPYDYESSLLHPRAVIVPFDQDSADVYLEVKRSECLYLRESPQAPFVSALVWQLGNASFQWHDTLVSFAPAWDRRSVRLAWDDLFLENESTNQIKTVLQDVLRKTNATWNVSVSDPQSNRAAFNTDRWPYSSQHAVVGDTVLFQAPAGSLWRHASIPVPESMPAPPFSFVKDRSDTLQPILRSSVLANEQGWASYVVDEGINVILDAVDTRNIVQLTHGTKLPYDQVRDLRLMIQSSRYITARSEFEQMIGSADPKAALDAFWLNCANEKDRGSQLISTYYGRVEEANRFFSGVLPGWRTDRGMVHIVFGIPQKIRKSRDSEWWIYGEEGSINAVTFRFLRKDHPWDNNFYRLGRNIQYRMPWDRMVTNWRNGRISPD